MLEQPALHTRFRAARLSAGLTQAQMAEKMRLSQGYISQIEAGKRTPTLHVLQLAANSTGVSVSHFIESPESP